MSEINEVKRGAKRKRDNEDIAQKLRTKFHHELKEVRKASKKVKTFETQKLVKRLKDARKTDDTQKVTQLEGELEDVKHSNHERIAALALKTKLNKDHVLSNNTDLNAIVSDVLPSLPTAQSGVAEKTKSAVEARLLSSKVLAQAVSEVLASLKAIIARDEPSDAKPGAGGAEEKKGLEDGDADDNYIASASIIARNRIVEESASEVEDGKEEEEFDKDNEVAEEAFNAHDEESEASDDAEGNEGWESGSVHDSDAPEDGSDGAQSSDSASTSIPPPSKMARAGKSTTSSMPSAPLKKVNVSESTFLPSLSMGFIRGGSDSDWSDGDEAAGEILQRKNRRGQRARKAIWEKKYGKNANHIRKNVEQGQDGPGLSGSVNAYGHDRQGTRGRGRGRGRGQNEMRGRGGGGHIVRDSKTTSTGPSSSLPVHASRLKNFSQSHMPSGENRAQSQSQENSWSQSNAGATQTYPRASHGNGFSRGIRDDNSKPLHPSWEAKKRLKEKHSAAILPAQGTRLKFD